MHMKNHNKKPIPTDIMPSRELDGDCYDLIMAIENGEFEFERIADYDEFMKISKQAAKNYFKKDAKKDARVSFRISSADLFNIKHMAVSEGLPYQTYLTSIIHKLTTGKLVES